MGSPAPARDADGVSPTIVVAATVAGADTATIGVTGPTGDIPGESRYDPDTGIVGFTPTEPLEWTTSYTATVTDKGEKIADWRFTTAKVPDIENSAAFLPETPDRSVDDPDVQVGTRFTPSVDGAVSGIRVFVGADNKDSHTGYLWGPDGTLLATVEFTKEATNGWRTGVLSAAIDLTAGAEYRVTVTGSGGRYARVPDGLALPLINGFLSSPSSAGVYGYGYPDQTVKDSFLVDVIFSRKR